MRDLTRYPGLLVLALGMCLSPAFAQEGESDDMEQVEDVIVVTASRTEQRLHEVPAAISVLTSEQIEQIPADDYGDFLRNVPGLNVSQMSARDIVITGRGATNSLAASELVLLDNRTLYLDFFGFVMWDFVPLDTKEIKQIEVVRGPGSAVWGANAMSGVINLITKKPQEMQGTSLTLGGGDFGTGYASITHAGVGSGGNLGYKFSASYYEQDPYDRPTGVIPGSQGPTNPTGTPYPPFENKGTQQPKVNFRVDKDSASGESAWTFSGGHASTDGIIHTGLGPFDIDSGSLMNFLKADWTKRAQRVTFFINQLDGDAQNLLTRGLDGQPLNFEFQSDTYNLDYSNTKVAGTKNIISYGATARQNDFDLSIAPSGDSRQEYGFYLQDEILFNDKVRWLIGARWDNIDPIDSVVSPRTSLLIAPKPNHTLRFSFNRAFRAPSMINNFLDVTIFNAAVLPPIPQAGLFTPTAVFFPARALGNPLTTEERLDAVEAGYVGTFGRNTFTLSIYENETSDSIDFYTAANHTSSQFFITNPPIPGPVLDFLLATALRDAFPALFSYRNIGETVDRGLELSFNANPNNNWSWFFNYSYQDEPEVSGIDQVVLPNGTLRDGVNSPPEHRVNLGIAFDNGNWFVNSNANYVDDAFWTDVLDARFWGPTEAFTQINLGIGVRWGGDKGTFSINAQNLLEEDVQQHVFGDLIDRKITGQLIFRF